MTPLTYRDGGAGEAIAYACRDTALGALVMAATTEVAQGIGAPKAVRAAASACAANKIAVLIPCHRVLRGDGGLGGYRWGIERKRALIDAERSRRAS
jgi:O-6-methylguanine DNA methyltransferase